MNKIFPGSYKKRVKQKVFLVVATEITGDECRTRLVESDDKHSGS